MVAIGLKIFTWQFMKDKFSDILIQYLLMVTPMKSIDINLCQNVFTNRYINELIIYKYISWNKDVINKKKVESLCQNIVTWTDGTDYHDKML